MTLKDDLLRAADIIVSCSDLALGFPHAKEYADLASRLRAAAHGCVCVPREPTSEMIQAFHDRHFEGAGYIDKSSIVYALYVECYRAMLAAAPGGKDG